MPYFVFVYLTRGPQDRQNRSGLRQEINTTQLHDVIVHLAICAVLLTDTKAYNQ